MAYPLSFVHNAQVTHHSSHSGQLLVFLFRISEQTKWLLYRLFPNPRK